jgi:hypothetical protein
MEDTLTFLNLATLINAGVVRPMLRKVRELRATVEQLDSYRFYSRFETNLYNF